MLSVGGLFSGIGGWELGLERAGMQVRWHCEADPFCRAVLARRWPDVPRYPDVRDLRADNIDAVDVLCGGFPCQDLSAAGFGAGIDGEQSGLWREFARLIRELQPRYVLVENVAALRSRGLNRVLGDLAACGMDAEWDCIPAAAVGAPQVRDRIWIVAYPQGDGLRPWRTGGPAGGGPWPADGACGPRVFGQRPRPAAWAPEPDVDRVAYGLPDQVDRGRAIGNALVPQIPELIGRRILEFEEGRMTVGTALPTREEKP